MMYAYVDKYFRMILLVQLLVFVYISVLFLLDPTEGVKLCLSSLVYEYRALLSGSRYVRYFLVNGKFMAHFGG